MKSTLIALGLSAAMITPALAADGYTFDARHTLPVFEINHLGFSTQRGRFNTVDGKITLDIAAQKGSVEFSIDAASIDMGLDKWDEHMRSDDFFNVATFPKMTFKSDKLLFSGDKVSGAEGTFTMLGVSKPMKITVSGFNCGTHPINKKPLCAGDVSATLKRSEFGMMKYLPAISDEVKLLIPVEAFKD